MKLSKELTTVTTLSKILALAMYVVVLALGFLLGVQYQKGKQPADKINSYDECVDSGGRVAESYPSVCYVLGGTKSFTNPHQKLPRE
jgi:hypothetical protein